MQEPNTATLELPTSIATMTENEAISIVNQTQNEGEKPICLILARKHSRRLPGKNKKLLNGIPMVSYPVEAAKESGLFGAIIVSSDDMEILEIAYEHKSMIHKRAFIHATAKVQQKEVVRMLLQIYYSDIFCLLTPCNPFVTADDLKAGYDILMEKEANYVISVSKGKPIEYALTRNKDGFITPRLGMKRTQALKPVYYADGGFVFARSEAFANEFDYGFYGSRCALYETPHVSVDIDTENDYQYAKYLMEGKW